VLSGRIQNNAVGTTIGAPDSKHSSKDWRSGYQDSDNEHSIYIALLTGYQIGIREGARSVQMRAGFIKRNFNFEKSQELKGRSEKFKNL
jgi:hypothetical protein